MSLLTFKKGSHILDITCGYYFKNELLSRYKSEAIAILRKRVEEAGSKVGDKSQTNFEKGMKVLPDEWAVIHEAYEQSCNKTKKTNIAKKPYWNKRHARMLARRIEFLKQKQEDVRARIVIYADEQNIKIGKIQDEIAFIEKQLQEQAQ